MLRFRTWSGVMTILLVLAGVFFVALPRASASPGFAQKPATVASSHQERASALSEVNANGGGLCSYSTTATTVIIDSDKWNNTTYFCGTGYLEHEIDRANDLYDNGGGPMWVKWYAGSRAHFCSISGLGAYWEFSPPVKITQISYGTDHKDSYCP